VHFFLTIDAGILMEEIHRQILTFLKEQGRAIPWNKFPDHIKNQYPSGSALINELEIKLSRQKGWVENKPQSAGFNITHSGIIALQADRAQVALQAYVSELEFEKLKLEVKDLQERNRYSRYALIISVIGIVISVIALCTQWMQ
jgi:hypothetical protein